jgi:acetyl esterase/lipase
MMQREGFMAQIIKVTAILLVLAACAAAGTAWSQPYQPPPPFEAYDKPDWYPAPGSPRVYYAPNIPGDLFWVGSRYFYYHGGYWYRGDSMWGPWYPVRNLPAVLMRLDRGAFKQAPPW